MTERFEAMGTVFEKADKHPGVIVPVSGHIYEIEKAAREAQAAEFQRIDAWVEEKQGDLDKPHSVTVGYTEAFWWHRHLTAKGFEVGGLPDDLAEENLRVETRPQEVALTVRRREEPDEGDDDIETLGGPPEDIGDAVGRRLAPGYGMTDARRASCRWQPL
ncbi:MAG: hypothetical protein KC766_10495, partial [Myxococcales bacterium]|nr:hypothetical protein [Myxococcales bacterium]